MVDPDHPPVGEMLSDPAVIAQKQVELAADWVTLYEGPPYDSKLDHAGVILNNPINYWREIGSDKTFLPRDARETWSGLLAHSSGVADIIDKLSRGFERDPSSDTVEKPREWDPDMNGLEKLKVVIDENLVRRGHRPDVAGIVKLASELFAEFTAVVPGTTAYYASEIEDIAAWLREHQQNQ